MVRSQTTAEKNCSDKVKDLDNINRVKKSEWKDYIKQTYTLAAEKLPKKMKRELGA